jgi:hypothetical protein
MIEPNPFETLRQIAAGYCLSRGLHVADSLQAVDGSVCAIDAISLDNFGFHVVPWKVNITSV